MKRITKDQLMQFPDGEPCNGCAALKGTEASMTDQTVKDFRECVRTGEPFYCHEDMTNRYSPVTRLCRGWTRAMNAKRSDAR